MTKLARVPRTFLDVLSSDRGPRQPLTSLAAPAAASLVSVFAGLAIARGNTVGMLVVAAVAGVAPFLLFSSFGWPALVCWIVLQPLAYPFLRFPSESSLVTFDRIWILALLGVILLGQANRLPSRPSRFLVYAFGWLVVAYGVRAVFSVDPESGNNFPAVGTWIDAIVLPLVLFLVVRRLAWSAERVRAVTLALAVAGTTAGAIAIGQRIVGFNLASLSGGDERFDKAIGLVRVSGPYSEPYVLATVLLITLAATLYWLQTRSGPLSVIGYLAVAIQLGAVGLTFFRAAWIGAVVVVVVCLGLRPKRYGRLFTVASVTLVLILSAFALSEQENSAVNTRLGDRDHITARLATYVDGARIFQAAPLFGVGVKQFGESRDALLPTAFAGLSSRSYPHSTYFGTLAEQGLWGFAPLLVLTFAIFNLIRLFNRRSRDRTDVVLGACVAGGALGYLVMSLTLTMLPYGPSNAFLAVALGMVAARMDLLDGQHLHNDSPA